MLTRIWTLLLALAFGAALAGIYLTSAELNVRSERQAQELLVRDWREIEQALSLEANRRVGAIAGIAVHPDVRSALMAASTDRPVDYRALRHALRTLNTQLQEGAADRLIAVRADGRIVADLGAEGVPPERAGMGAFPVVRDALRGYLADDVIVYDGAVLRVAARPVVDEGRYVGAIVHGKRLDEQLAAQLQKLVSGTTVAIFRGTDVLGIQAPADVRGAPDADALAAGLSSLADDPGAMRGRHSKPLDLGGKGWAVAAPITGSAAHAGVGVIVARPAPSLASPAQLLSVVSRDELRAVPWIVVGGAALVLLLFGWMFYAIDATRPRKKFERAVEGLSGDEQSRLKVAEVPGAFRKSAERINAALDAVAARAAALGGRKSAELREILESPKEAEESASYFGFASEPPKAAETHEAARAAAQPVPPPPAPPRETYDDAPTLSMQDEEARATAAPETADEPERPTLTGEERTTEPPPAAAPRTPPAPKPAIPAPPAAVPPAPAPPPFDPHGFDDDGATTVAEIPRELIAAVQEQKAPPMDPETAHFHEVYEQFIEMKTRLGEPTAGLTYERFEVTLKKNRDAIVEKHGVSTVRFTVYDKGGKAALRATPVK